MANQDPLGNQVPSGSTPADDSDLHGNGANPYASGSPARKLGASAGTDRFASSPGGAGPAQGPYYMNPPTSGAGNPYSGGAQDQYGAASDLGMSGGLDALYGDLVSNRQPAYDGMPTDQQRRIDSGIDDSLVPPDQQR